MEPFFQNFVETFCEQSLTKRRVIIKDKITVIFFLLLEWNGMVWLFISEWAAERFETGPNTCRKCNQTLIESLQLTGLLSSIYQAIIKHKAVTKKKQKTLRNSFQFSFVH